MRRIGVVAACALLLPALAGCGDGGDADSSGTKAPLAANSLPTPTVAARPVCRHLSTAEVAAQLPGTFAAAESEHGRLPSCTYTATQGVLELDVVIGPGADHAAWAEDATFAHEPVAGVGEKATFNFLEAGFSRIGSTSAVSGSKLVVTRVEVDVQNSAVSKEKIQAATADLAKVVISRL